MLSEKKLGESSSLSSGSSKCMSDNTPTAFMIHDEGEQTIPIIDFSLLISGTPDQRSKVVRDIGHACREWGCFLVINHGVSQKLMEDMITVSQSFFNITEEEKREYVGEDVFSPITCGHSLHGTTTEVNLWRDYLRAFVHPDFYFPNKPPGLRDIAQEYSKRAREVAIELFKGISESLGLEENYIHKQMELDEGLHIMNVNHYPPCPQPLCAMGLPPHSDHGFLSLLIQNDISGLDILHKGQWVPVCPRVNSFIVNVADHLEVLTNGKYKTLLHRAMVNNTSTRMSVVIGHGPKFDTIVSPAPELVDGESNPPAYRPTKYREYYEFQRSNQLDPKTSKWRKAFLDHVRL